MKDRPASKPVDIDGQFQTRQARSYDAAQLLAATIMYNQRIPSRDHIVNSVSRMASPIRVERYLHAVLLNELAVV